MKTKRWFAGAFALCAFGVSSPSSAQLNFESGNTLYESCTAPRDQLVNMASCVSYIRGAFDALMFDRTMDKKGVCTPQNITGEQLRDIVVKWLRDNPELRSYPGGMATRVAIIQAWPDCGR